MNEVGAAGDKPGVAAGALAPTALAFADLAREREHRLPHEHPRWPHDRVHLSARARTFFANTRLLPQRILGFWDHPARHARIGSGTLCIDPCGSYRLI